MQNLQSVNAENDINIETDDHSATNDVWIAGWWRGSLGELSAGVKLDEITFQKYTRESYGFTPDDLPQDISYWKLEKEIEKYVYNERKSVIYPVIQ